MHGINLHLQTEEIYPFITKLLAFVMAKLAAVQRLYHVLRLQDDKIDVSSLRNWHNLHLKDSDGCKEEKRFTTITAIRFFLLTKARLQCHKINRLLTLSERKSHKMLQQMWKLCIIHVQVVHNLWNKRSSLHFRQPNQQWSDCTSNTCCRLHQTQYPHWLIRQKRRANMEKREEEHYHTLHSLLNQNLLLNALDCEWKYKFGEELWKLLEMEKLWSGLEAFKIELLHWIFQGNSKVSESFCVIFFPIFSKKLSLKLIII